MLIGGVLLHFVLLLQEWFTPCVRDRKPKKKARKSCERLKAYTGYSGRFCIAVSRILQISSLIVDPELDMDFIRP